MWRLAVGLDVRISKEVIVTFEVLIMPQFIQLPNLEINAPEKDNEDLAKRLKNFNSRWEQLAQDENAQQEADAFKKILDAERPSGQKLYSAE
jgi:hypothetical protein